MVELSPDRIDTVVIGGGQAGLATSYHLTRLGIEHVVLDKYLRVGDAWRQRWDSLHLFTPGRLNSLPGMPFGNGRAACPTKDEMADYLDAYAGRFELPIRTGTEVERVRRTEVGFEVEHGGGCIQAQNVVVAAGIYHHPRIPDFSRDLAGDIFQLHSNEYRRPSQLQDGSVLVVGAGNSGAEIAVELADRHRVWLSGPDTGQEPVAAGSKPGLLFAPLVWFVFHRVLKVTTPWGRKARDHFMAPPRGLPLARVRRKEILAAGIERVPRVTGVQNGYPMLEDGRVLEVDNVVWCTGFVPGFDWIDLPVFDDYGFPVQYRGVVDSVPGLYFMGIPFQYSPSSALVGGVGRDAQYIASHIRQHRSPVRQESDRVAS